MTMVMFSCDLCYISLVEVAASQALNTVRSDSLTLFYYLRVRNLQANYYFETITYNIDFDSVSWRIWPGLENLSGRRRCKDRVRQS